MSKKNIPKVIHYCWFGNNEKSDLILRCIESWKVYLPDFEIKEWNETNFDVNCCPYVSEAYKAQKWAFVSDYCRMWVLSNFGGVYFDTDVELIKNPQNIFEEPTIGFETKCSVNPGLVIACGKDDWFCNEMLESYLCDHFYVDNKMNLKTICERATSILVSHGLRLNNKLQYIDGYYVYPSEYFNPMGSNGGYLKVTSNTISIHNFAGTWIDDKVQSALKYSTKGKVFILLTKVLGTSVAKKIRCFYKKIIGGR